MIISPPLKRTALWLGLVLVAFVLLLRHPEWRSAETWLASFVALGDGVWLVAVLLQLGCSLLMIPSLPLVAALAMLMPDSPLAVLALAMSGVAISALAIYWYAGVLGMDAWVAGQARLQQARWWFAQHGRWALALWCATPFLPSDAGCYAAASARLPLPGYLAAVMAGELVLCASVVFGISTLVRT